MESTILLILEFLLFIAIVSFLIFIQPIAALTIFSFFFISTVVFDLIFKNKIRLWGIQRQDLDNKIIKNLTETFGGITEIKIFKKENFFFKRFTKDVYKKAGIVSKNDIIGQLPRLYLEYITVVSVLGLMIIMSFIEVSKNESNLEKINTVSREEQRVDRRDYKNYLREYKENEKKEC